MKLFHNNLTGFGFRGLCAKVSGPLSSESASGKFGQIVFGTNRTVQVARRLVKPTNPNTQNQRNQREVVSLWGQAVRVFQRITTKPTSATQTVKEYLNGRKSGAETWNSRGLKDAFPSNFQTITTAKTTYDALAENEKTAWNTAATSAGIGLSGRVRKSDGQNQTAGEAWYIIQYGLWQMGYLTTAPGASPVTFE